MKQSIIVSLTTSLAVGAIAFAGGSLMVQRALETRPPIAIIDYRPIANALTLGTPVDEVQPYFQQTKARANAYERAGFIVINAASIAAAPEDVFVPPLDDLPEAWTRPLPADAVGPRPNIDGLQEPPR